MDRNKLVRTVLLVIVFICFGYFIYYYAVANGSRKQADTLSEMTNRREAGEEVVIYESGSKKINVYNTSDRILPKYKSLYKKNKNLIGWIKIDDTNIDYPVMKSVNGNGNFYLDHDYDGKDDRNGTLFMDDACDPTGPSDNLIIYGHNMKSGLMFGQLDSYKSEAFYQNHKRVRFDTIYSEGIYEVAFAFQSRLYSEAEITFKYYQFIEPNSQEEFDSGIRQMQELSLYDTDTEIEYGDQLLTLSTCDYDEENGRFVVVCKRVQ